VEGGPTGSPPLSKVRSWLIDRFQASGGINCGEGHLPALMAFQFLPPSLY
jgi:hypothetical protein